MHDLQLKRDTSRIGIHNFAVSRATVAMESIKLISCHDAQRMIADIWIETDQV